MTFTETIIKLRKNANMSQQEVADRIGLARATYGGLETGRRDPSLSELLGLAELYQISPADLIEGNLPTELGVSGAITFQKVNVIEPREIIEVKPEKLREVLLYVLDKIGAKPNVGETVLYKMLYFIDFDYYEKHGKSITGLTYVRNHFGPTPQAQTFSGVVEAMKQAGQLEVIGTKYFNHLQKKYLPTIRPELKTLNAEELQHIDEELARLGEKSASELTNLSHKDTPWIVTKDKETIDYQFAMYRTPLTSVREFEDEL